MDEIFKRRSVRSFTSEPVGPEKTQQLLRAAMQAPSACNTQAWEFIAVTDRSMLDRIAESHPYAKMCREATLAIIVLACPDMQSGISDGFFPQDCAAVTENILLEAVSLGLGAVWCGVYPKERLISLMRELMGIPEDRIPFNIIAVGYPRTEPKVVDRYDPAKVHYDRYGKR
ncbi:MAG TPA: nitroreductase family protein [Clostridiales bacterium]|nr:nitroreductase family protein [Clostridiales bacterium]